MLNTQNVMSSLNVRSIGNTAHFLIYCIRKYRMKIRMMSGAALNSHIIIRRYKTKLNEESFMNGPAATYVEEMFNLWLKDRNSVHASWDIYFKHVLNGAPPGHAYQSPPTIKPGTQYSLPTPHGTAQRIQMVPTQVISATSKSPAQAVDKQFIYKQQLLVSVITAYQNRGHLVAKLDPLGLTYSLKGPKTYVETVEVHQPDRTAIYSKIPELIEKDMDTVFDLPSGTYIGGDQSSLPFREIINRLENAYCKHIGVEIAHIESEEISEWIKQQFEPPHAIQINNEKKRLIFEEIAESHLLESFMDKKWHTQVRFSLEGNESLIPGLTEVVDVCAVNGAESIILGMAHRGRMNVLAIVCKRPIELLFAEFLEIPREEKLPSDVKYHLGSNSAVFNKAINRNINITLLSNPSHLEAVNPVTNGRARAEQKLKNDTTGNKVVPIVIHGDAGMAGQGVVFENFNLAELPCYTTKGTIHIVTNNQIGYTTVPSLSRSSSYCTGVAKMMDAPIFHVNSDDPEAVIHCCKVAAEFRNKFHRDVVIDIIGYRRKGHNENDDPKPTSPLFYQKILSTKPVFDLYGKKLISEKVISEEEFKSIVDKYNSLFTEAFNKASNMKSCSMKTWVDIDFEPVFKGKDPMKIEPTGVKEDILTHIGKITSTPPPGNFGIQKSAAKQIKAREDYLKNNKVSWALAEALAIGSLLKEGIHVRLTGEDSARGTFHQRHHVYYDVNKETETYTPLNNLYPDQEQYCICNSPLSEYACLGFELGYATTLPDALVLWEAQYGDFANVAQPMFDNFLAPGEVKWLNQCGIVVMLPHGMEGAGPEHSSGRCERFLQLSSDDPDIVPDIKDPNHVIKQLRDINWIVANCTTPANVFHILRRQVKLPFRKPLIFMTAKSLLRHPDVISPISDLFEGTEFKRVIPDDGPANQAPDQVERLLFCSGKAYYDIKKERDARKLEQKIAITRIEQLCPFPYDLVSSEIKKYPKAELCWGQEEHKNSGPWNYVFPRIDNAAGEHRNPVIYAGRVASASTATGLKAIYNKEKDQYINECLTLSTSTKKKPSPKSSSNDVSTYSAAPLLMPKVCTKYHEIRMHHLKPHTANIEAMESKNDELCFEQYAKSIHKAKKIYPEMNISKIVKNISKQNYNIKPIDVIFGSVIALKPRLQRQHPMHSVCSNIEESSKSHKTTDIIFGSIKIADLEKKSTSDCINTKQNTEPIKEKQINPDFIDSAVSNSNETSEGTTHRKQEQSKQNSESNICLHTKFGTNAEGLANQDKKLDFSKTKQIGRATIAKINTLPKIEKTESHSSNLPTHDTKTLLYANNASSNFESKVKNSKILNSTKETIDTETGVISLNNIILNTHADMNPKRLKNKTEIKLSNTISKNILPITNNNGINIDDKYINSSNHSTSQTEYKTILSSVGDASAIKDKGKAETVKTSRVNEENVNIKVKNKQETVQDKSDLENMPQKEKCIPSKEIIGASTSTPNTQESAQKKEDVMDNEWKQTTESSEKSSYKQLAKLLVKTVLKCTPVNNNSSMTCELRPTGIINTAINRSLDNSIQASDKYISSLEGKEFNQKNDSIQWLMTVGLAIDKEKHDNNTSRTQSLRKSSSEIFNRFNMQFPKLESKKSETYFQKQAGKDDNKEITPCISEERFDRCLTKYMEEESNSSQVLSPPNIETELKPAKIHFIDNETIQFSADNMDKISENHSKSPTAELDVNSIFQKTLRPKPAPSLRSSPTKTIDSFYSSLLDNSDIFEIENTLIITEIVPKPKPVRNDFKASNINDTSSLPADEREVILNENNIKAITESHSNKTQFTIKNEEFKPSVLISKNCASEEQIKNVENHRKRALQNTRSNSEISHNKNEMTSLNFLSKNKTKIPRPVSAPLQGLIETRNKVTSNHENQNLKLSAPKLLKTNPSLKKCKSTDPVPNYHKPLSVIYETSNKNKTAETKHLGPPKKKLPKMYSLEQVNLPASFSQFDHEQFQSQYLNDPNVNELENKTNLTRSSASNASTDHSVSNVNRKDDHSGRSIQKVNLLNATSDNKKKLIKPNIEYIRTNLNKAKEGRSIVKQSPKNISKSSTHQSAAKNMPEDELSRKVQASIQKALAKVSKKHSITTPNTKNVILLEKNINKPSHIVDNGVANSFNIRKEKCKQLLQDRIMKYTKKREKIEKSKNATFSLPETLPNNTELKGTETTNIEISTTDLKLVSSQENKTLTNINNVRLKNRFEKIKEEKRKNINSLTNKLSLKNTKNNRSHQISVKLNTIDEFSVEKRGQKLTENNIQFMKTIFPSDQKKMNQNSEEQNNMSVNENIKKICPITDESVMMKKSYAGTSEMAHKQTPHNKSKSSSCLKDDNGNLSSHDHDDDLKVKDKHYVQFIPSNDIQSFLSSQNQILNTELQKSIYEENIQKISNKLLENIQYENRICTKFKNQDDINSNLIALQKPVLLDTDKEKMLSNHIFKDRNPKKQNKELTSFNTNVQDNSHFIDKTSCTAREHEVNDTLNNIKINTETFEVIYMVDTEWSSSKAQVDMKISGPEKESTSSNSRAKFILDYLKKKYEAPEKTNTKDILTLKRDRNSMNIEKLNEMDDFLKSNNHNYSNPSALSQSIEKIEAQVGISKYKQQPIVEPPTVIPSTKSNLAESNVIDDNRNCVTEENKTTSLKFEKNNLDTTQQERKTEDSIINIKNDLQNKEIYKKDLKEFETSCSFTQGSEFEQVNLSNCKNVIKHRNNQLIKCDNSEIKDKESFSLISNAVHNFHPNSSIQQDRESQHSINSNKTDLLNEEIFTKSTYGCRTVENNTEESEFRPVNLSNMKSLIEHRINQLTKHDNCDIRVKENLSTFTGAPKLKMVNAHQIKLHVSESEPFLDYKVKTNEPNLKINLTDVLNHNNNLSISVQEKDKLQCNIFQTEEENNTLKENSEIKLSPPTISINDSPIPYDLQPKTIMCQNNDESRLVEAQTSKSQIVQIQSKETLRTSSTKIEDHKIQNDDFHCSDDKASINKSKEALSSKYSTSEQSQQKYSKTGGGKCYISNSLTTNQEVIDIKKTSTDIDKFKKFMLPTCNWDILKTYAFPTSPVDSATDEDLSTISSLPCSFQSDKLYPLEKDNICHSRKSETTDKIISFCGKSTDGIQNMKSYFVNNLSPSKLNLNSSVISKERSIENNLNGNSKFLTLIEALQLSEIRLHKAVTQTNLENENDTKLLRNSLSDTNTGIELENPKFQSISFIDISSSSIPLDNTEGTLAKEVHTSTENLGMKTITNENMISTGTSSHTSTVLAMIQPDLTVNETGKSEETHENVLSSDEPDKLRMNSDKATIQMNLPMIILDGKELQLTEYKESNNFISNKTDETEESKNYLQTTLTNYGSNLPMIISDEVNKKKNHLLTAFINHSNNLPMIIPDNSTKFPLLTGTGTENGNLSDINKKTLYNDNNKESYQNPTSFENNITASDKKNCLKMSTDCFEVHKNMKNKTDYLCRNNNDCSLSPLTGKYEGTSSTTSVSLIPHSNKENMREETSKGNENKPTYDDPMTNIKLLHLEKVPFIQPKDLNYKHTQVPIKSINENANTEILNKRKINMINNQLQPPIKRTILHNEVKSIEKKENNPANKFERKKFNQIRQNNPNMKKAKNMKVTLKAVDQTSRQTLIPESKKMSPLTDKSPVFITPTHANRENNIIDNACTCHLRKPIKDKITVPQANIKLSGIRKPYKTINSSGNRKKNQRITDNKTLNSTTVSKVNLNPKYNITTENEQSIHQSLSEKAHGVKYRDKHELTETKTPPLDQSLQYENNTKLKVQGVKNVNNNLEYKEKLEITKVEIPAQDLDQSLQNEYISLKIQGLISRNNDNKNHDTKNVSSCLELNESNIFENKIDSSSFVLDTKNINNNYNDYEEESDMKYITSVKEVSDPKIPGASIKMITFNFIPECEKNTFDNINEIKNSKLESSLAIYQNNLSNLNDNTNKNLDKPRMSIIHNNNPSGKTDTITTTNNKSNTVSSKLNLPNSNPKREILVSTLKKNNTLYEKHKVLDETNTGTTEIPNDANKHSTAEAVMYDTDQQVQSINKQEDKKDYEDLYYSDENYDDSKYIISSNETDDSDISGIKSFRFNFAQPRMEGNATNDAEDNINDNMKK